MIAPLATIGPSVYWYLARGTGAVTLVMLTASVVLGIVGSLRVSGGRWPRFAIETVHRDVSLLIIIFLLIHIAASVLDSFAPIALTAAVIPFISTYRPLWLGLGTVAFDLVIALAVTSLVRRRLGYRTWRGIHWLAYLSWPVAVLHGLGTGSDAKVWWMLLLTAACVAAVVAGCVVRFARGEGTPAALRAPALALSVAVPVGLAAFTLAGPLAKGWAKRAGTPANLLAHHPRVIPVSTPAAPAAPAAAPLQPFNASLLGTVSQSNVNGGAIVDLDLHLGGSARGRLRVRLGGSPIPGGGLQMTGSQVDLQKTGLSTVLAGQITSLEGSNFIARLRGAGGALTITVRLNIDQQTGNVSGSLNAVTG